MRALEVILYTNKIPLKRIDAKIIVYYSLMHE